MNSTMGYSQTAPNFGRGGAVDTTSVMTQNNAAGTPSKETILRAINKMAAQ